MKKLYVIAALAVAVVAAPLTATAYGVAGLIQLHEMEQAESFDYSRGDAIAESIEELPGESFKELSTTPEGRFCLIA